MNTPHTIIAAHLREVSEAEAEREALKYFRPDYSTEQRVVMLASIITKTARCLAWYLEEKRPASYTRKLIAAEIKRETANDALRAWGEAVGAKYDHARGCYLAMAKIAPRR